MNNNIIQFTYKRDDIMCKVLEKIHNKTPEELLKEYGVYDSLPIDLEKLAKAIGISVLPMDFTELEKVLDRKDILGLVLTSGNNAAIFYKKTDSINRIRFTIAHELAHSCFADPNMKTPHIEYRLDEQDKDEFEKKMDIFAGELLIPFHKLKEEYMKLFLPNSVELAEKFKVSVNVMEARLNHLGISYYSESGEPVFYGK
ncbi:MAG: ImmA/IrrE family metallo-endopeptidase [Lachnospiraceae bacterium]|nr:ImmA/IrrE family metallo-endopeptidase [Lachnospiraceae bacterium]